MWNELENVASLDDPRSRGKVLTGHSRGLRRYRVQDYRVICEIQASRIVIVAIDIEYRSTVYRKK
ncbi:MAG TPA: type II toxin-antitoxin system mRNA interferase toxin, RelE/StbE family [Coriobacteriia bacterium]|nr:type II toxin-antitoxin system mRNA interferase toxin, RelE/StbE family [Coriobacteriia bacterium]